MPLRIVTASALSAAQNAVYLLQPVIAGLITKCPDGVHLGITNTDESEGSKCRIVLMTIMIVLTASILTTLANAYSQSARRKRSGMRISQHALANIATA